MRDNTEQTEDDSAGFADWMPSLPVWILVGMFLMGFWSVVFQLRGFWL